MEVLYVVAGIVLAVGAWVLVSDNRFVERRNLVRGSWSNVGLQRRYELIPHLRPSRHFLALQSELTDTEDRIQTARHFYNANVREWNRRIQSVPSNIVAWTFSFREEDYLEVDPAVRESGAPSASSGTSS